MPDRNAPIKAGERRGQHGSRIALHQGHVRTVYLQPIVDPFDKSCGQAGQTLIWAHVLFEGNHSHNADSDDTHGNAVYHTFFRNYLRCIRAPFDNQAGGRIDDATQPPNGPRRCAGLMAYSYWMSFVGNVLGATGKMDGWSFETTFDSGKPGIWMLGWDAVKPYRTDAQVSATALRHGNFDYLTNTVKWDPEVGPQALPNSLYLRQKPTFFDAGRGYVWPWVDPAGDTKLHTLPAKARYDAGTPFRQP